MSSPKSSPVVSPGVLLGAYVEGVFPMADGGELVWFEPKMRGVIPLDEGFHVPHGLKRTLGKGMFRVEWDRDFRGTVEGCAAREETWIDAGILESYEALYRLGYAHSVEVYDGEGLQGGLYGVALGRAFFGESMFSRKTDASKVALVHLVDGLRRMGGELLDTQWMTAHLRQFGGYEIPRDEYRRRLAKALEGEAERGYPPPRLGRMGGG